MSNTNIRFPQISGTTEAEQLRQIQTYLFQLCGDLNYTLGVVDREIQTSVETAVTTAGAKAAEETPKTRFEQIKGLIIKSADVVNAYYEEINSRLSGQYVAESDFGTFRQDTEMALAETSTGITQIYTNIQAIETDITDLQDSVIGVTAYIRTGQLDEVGGVPIYGMEIGQQTEVGGTETFRKFTRLTSDKLSFYDANENEVAYVSDRVLHIDQAEINTMTVTTATIGSRLNLGSYTVNAGTDGHLTIS